jgi:hypothetical protein
LKEKPAIFLARNTLNTFPSKHKVECAISLLRHLTAMILKSIWPLRNIFKVLFNWPPDAEEFGAGPWLH